MVVVMMLLVMMMILIVVEFARLVKSTLYELLHLIEDRCNYYHYYLSLKDETEFLTGNLSFQG